MIHKLNRILVLIRQFIIKCLFSIGPSFFYDYDGRPKRCSVCGCTTFHSVIKDTIQGSVCEEAVICNHCGATVSYWAYGYYEPTFKIYGAVKKTENT